MLQGFTGLFKLAKAGTNRCAAICIEELGQRKQQTNRCAKQKVLDKETKVVYKSIFSEIVNRTCAASGAQSYANCARVRHARA
jgi:hypothetical protein